MLVVTGIISILTAIAVPNFVSMRPGLRLNGASREVFGKLMWARAQAVEENITYSVAFTSNHTLQIIRDANANGSADVGESTRIIKTYQKPCGWSSYVFVNCDSDCKPCRPSLQTTALSEH